jgi:hypothetical protein
MVHMEGNMAQNLMARPELRHPFDASPLHPEGSATVLYQGKVHTVETAGVPNRLLVRPADLVGINGFELKPQGACLGELCYPLPEGLLVEQDGESWFDLAAFADHIGQPCVADPEAGAWSFAEIPAKRERLLTDAMAPDFEITDRTGKVIRRADLKGKKALIVTWSSW